MEHGRHNMADPKEVPFKRKRRHHRNITTSLLCVLAPLAIVETLYYSTLSHKLDTVNTDVVQDEFSSNAVEYFQGRHLLQMPPNVSELNCTPRAIYQFPPELLDREQRRNGGIVLYIGAALYFFVAIAIACDDFFVPVLEKLCTALNVQPDVAGATLMAAGSSAPEFFASVIGVFFAKSDIGLSTIVGSAVFNLLLVNGIIGIFTGAVIYLTWWPVMRDCTYYLFSVIVLVVVIHDEIVHWYEALIMVLLYITYVCLMYFNRPASKYFLAKVTCCQDYSDRKEDRSEKKELLTVNGINNSDTSTEYGASLTKTDESSLSTDSEDYESPLSRPEGCCKNFLWVLMLPVTFLMTMTIPDFRRGGCWSRLYVLTFIMCCVWIGGLSYLLVWMVTVIGDTLDIPDSVMGLTLLAIGSSVPDAVASLLVAKDGFGNMAVSNSVGSNVFDVLLCLGLPWLFQTAIVYPGSRAHIDSAGLTYAAVSLMGTIVFLVGGLWANRWRLDIKFGALCLMVYSIVIVMACLCELNLFGFINLPMCPF